ncbi:MAG: hypothetical protein RLZZ618_3873 [Pseudomonadota bacterium]|jgi:ABC-type transport system involved in multi-copper enzyme maturation permease subunit
MPIVATHDMQPNSHPATTRHCVILGVSIGILWLLGVGVLFTCVRDPVFGDWGNGDPSDAVVLMNVVAYVATCVFAAVTPAFLSSRFRSPRALIALCLAALTPLVLLVALVLWRGNMVSLVR